MYVLFFKKSLYIEILTRLVLEVINIPLCWRGSVISLLCGDDDQWGFFSFTHMWTPNSWLIVLLRTANWSCPTTWVHLFVDPSCVRLCLVLFHVFSLDIECDMHMLVYGICSQILTSTALFLSRKKMYYIISAINLQVFGIKWNCLVSQGSLQLCGVT